MAAPKSKSRTNILIVDGHEKSRHVIAILLHKLGYKNVFEAGSRADAEKIITGDAEKTGGMNALFGGSGAAEACDTDLVIMDHDVPPENGAMYLAELRRKFDAGSLPVLFTVMKGNEDKLKAAGSLGANDTLVKPFTQNELMNKIGPMLDGVKAPVTQSFNFTGGIEQGSPPKPPSETKKMAEKPKRKKKEKPKSRVKSGGASFQKRSPGKKYSPGDPPTATLVNGRIDGHYHEEVDVIGGGENCYWARQVEGEDVVRLDYLNAKGQSTGMEAKVIDLEEFMRTFYLCEEYGCAILDRLEAEK